MNELLVFAPEKLMIAVLNYAAIHTIWTFIKNHYKEWFTRTERNLAIWTHYQFRAQGKGHTSGDILLCDQNTCQLFKQPVA